MAGDRSTADLDHGLFLPTYGAFADPDAVVELAVAAEEGGWDGVFLVDHLIDFAATTPAEHRPIADPWITLAGVAARTDRITLGSYVTPVARRQPWQLARNLAVLDQLSDGRVMLGAGLGTEHDYVQFGRPFDQSAVADRYDEALEVVTGLWRGEPFSFEGEHFTVDEAVLRPTPVQEPRIPIVIGGWWPYKSPFHRGARWDGIMPQWPTMIQHFSNVVVDELGEHVRSLVDEQRTHEAEVREMLEYYHDVADDPGEIVLRVDLPNTPPEFPSVCRELGVTWLLSTPLEGDDSVAENAARLREGPPTAEAGDAA